MGHSVIALNNTKQLTGNLYNIGELYYSLTLDSIKLKISGKELFNLNKNKYIEETVRHFNARQEEHLKVVSSPTEITSCIYASHIH